MAIAPVQGRATDGTGSSVALAFSSNVTAGSFLVAVTVGANTATYTCTDSRSQTWTAVDARVAGNTSGLRIWYLPNSLGGALTVTFGGTGGAYGIAIAEYSGVATSAPLDGTIHGTKTPPAGTAAAPTTNAFTPSANDIAIAAFGDDGPVINETLAAGTGWTQEAMSSSGNGYGVSIIHQVLTSSASVTGAWTGAQGTAANQEVAWAAFLAASGAPADPSPAYWTPPFIIARFP